MTHTADNTDRQENAMPQPEFIQVVIHPALQPHLEYWLALKGLALARMPIDNPNDLPTYGVTPSSSVGGTTTSSEEQP